MKCEYSTQAYQWEVTSEDGSHCWGTGVLVLAGCNCIASRCGAVVWPKDTDFVLVAHSYTRELEFVEFGKLQKYPPNGQKIEEPSK